MICSPRLPDPVCRFGPLAQPLSSYSLGPAGRRSDPVLEGISSRHPPARLRPSHLGRDHTLLPPRPIRVTPTYSLLCPRFPHVHAVHSHTSRRAIHSRSSIVLAWSIFSGVLKVRALNLFFLRAGGPGSIKLRGSDTVYGKARLQRGGTRQSQRDCYGMRGVCRIAIDGACMSRVSQWTPACMVVVVVMMHDSSLLSSLSTFSPMCGDGVR